MKASPIKVSSIKKTKGFEGFYDVELSEKGSEFHKKGIVKIITKEGSAFAFIHDKKDRTLTIEPIEKYYKDLDLLVNKGDDIIYTS